MTNGQEIDRSRRAMGNENNASSTLSIIVRWDSGRRILHQRGLLVRQASAYYGKEVKEVVWEKPEAMGEFIYQLEGFGGSAAERERKQSNMELICEKTEDERGIQFMWWAVI